LVGTCAKEADNLTLSRGPTTTEPEAHQGRLCPDWLLEPRRRAERALTVVVGAPEFHAAL
jgi:hypothetical protein